MDSSSRSLAFLLSLGGIPLACIGGSGETDTAATGSTSAATDTAATEGTGSTGSTGTAGTDSDGMTTSTTGETSVGETTGETTGSPADDCEAWAAKYAECDRRVSYREALAYCQETLEEYGAAYGPGCAEDFAAFYACLAGATCEQLANQLSDPICPEASAAVDQSCSPEVGALCMTYGAHWAECFGDLPGIELTCEESLGESFGVSMACGEAHEDLFACLNDLSCVDLEDDVGCEADVAAWELACE